MTSYARKHCVLIQLVTVVENRKWRREKMAARKENGGMLRKKGQWLSQLMSTTY